MRKIKNIGIVLLSAIMMLAIVGFFLLDREVTPPIAVMVPSQSGTERVTCWDDEDGQYYVFLPSYADLADVQIILETDVPIVMNGITLQNGMRCDGFAQNTPYELTYESFGKTEHKTLTFVQSANVATLFVSTNSGRTEYLHADKNNKEAGFVSLYTGVGQLNYQGKVDSVSGRGNYSWENSDKKPYNLILAETAELLGMGVGSKWVLLANSSDVSQMRNKMVYDFAKKIGLAYSPDSQWIDLYLNGEYRGVYLLSEAVEIGPDRVDISETDGAIIALETEDILHEKNDTYFLTDAGVAVEIRTLVSEQDVRLVDLQTRIQLVEDAFLSEDSILWKERIDVDSWVKKYLIDEVFGNLDAFIRSSYFYYDGSSDKLFAGPVWDYDMSAGNEYEWSFLHSDTFYVYRPARMRGYETPWIYNLCQKDEFWRQVAETYQLLFIPELERMMQITIDEYEGQICQAAKLDDIRWSDRKLRFEDSMSNLREYMEKRIDFLTEIWCEDRAYCVVQACQTSSGSYCFYVVYPGEKLSALPEFEDTESASFVGWYDAKTGEPFDITKPITEDIEIYAKWEDSANKKTERVAKLLPLFIITVVGILLLSKEVYLNKKAR